MEITFQPLKVGDLPVVKEIYDWYILHSTATFHTEPILPEQLLEFIHLDHPRYGSFLILAEDRPVGYCYLTFYKKRQAYDRTAELTLYLKQEVQGRGIGRATLAFLEDFGRKAGLKNLLGVITGENLASIALFEKCGYTQCARFRNVGEKFDRILDVVVYQKEI